MKTKYVFKFQYDYNSDKGRITYQILETKYWCTFPLARNTKWEEARKLQREAFGSWRIMWQNHGTLICKLGP